MTFLDIADGIEADLATASVEVFRCYATAVREDTPKGPGGLPFRLGFLQKGLQLTKQTYGNGEATAVFESQARAGKAKFGSSTGSSGFDYPAHLDQVGIHKGWWKKVNDQKILEDCAAKELLKFQL